jgi:non-heme chloroperoxidase
VTDHFADVIARLDQKPAIVGHSFGGLITQKLAGLGLGSVSVPIDPGPFRGVLPLPRSALKAAWPVIGNPANRKRAVMLTEAQFRFAFANAVDEPESKLLYETFPVPGSGIPLFQAAFANINPGTEAKVDSQNPNRGPMKIISGENDNTVPWCGCRESHPDPLSWTFASVSLATKLDHGAIFPLPGVRPNAPVTPALSA